MSTAESERERLRAFVLALAELLEPSLREAGVWRTSDVRAPPAAPPAEQKAPSLKTGLLSAEDAAEYLGMSKSWVYKAAEFGRLPCVRIGSALRFDPSELQAFVKSQRKSDGSIAR